MKSLQVIFVFLIALMPQFLVAQISIVTGDMPVVDDTLYTATDRTVAGITIGSAGANIIWDFSSVSQEELNTTYVRAPAATPYAANFPNATLAITTNFVDYIFIRNTAGAYTPHGIAGDLLGVGLITDVQFSPTADQYRFPTQYAGTFSGNSGFVKTIPAANLPQALRDSIQAQLPVGVTLLQVRATYTTNYLDNIDGWGKVITPVCSYSALRQRRQEYTQTIIEAQVSIFGFPSWQPVSNTRDTLINYNWLAKETKLPVVTVAFDATGINVNAVTYSLIPPALDADFIASKTSLCPGDGIDFTDLSNGCPTAWQWTFTGGNPSSSASQNPANITYNTPGTYPVVLQVTQSGQSNTETKAGYITVTNPVANAGVDDTICLGGNATLTASGGGTYLWSTGATTTSISVSPASFSNYTVTITNASGCTASDEVSVSVNPLPVADAGITDTICSGETGSLTATGGVSYLWNTGVASSTLSVSPSATTTYTVSVADANGCAASDTASVVVLSLPLADAGVNDTICKGQTGTLTASGGITYTWNTESISTQLSDAPIATTSYTVTVTGANGCTASDNASIVVNPLPAKELFDLTICFGSTTILDAGNPGAAFIWSTGETAQTISVSTEDEYSVTITDENGCSNFDTVSVSVGFSLTVNLSDHEICQGESVPLNAGNPGTTHSWSTGETTQTIIVSVSGIYSVTVSDAIGCSGEDSSIVLVNPLPNADAGVNDTICFGDTGSLTASGGILYAWSNGSGAAFFSESPASTSNYTVTVTDGNGCSATDDAMIIVQALPVADAGENDTICVGETSALQASGGVDYLWNRGDTSSAISASPLFTESYSVTVTDTNNCSASDIVAIVVNLLPPANAGADDSLCIGENIDLTTSGGTGYAWNTGETTSTINVSPSADLIYSVTVTDANGCSADDSVSIFVFALPVVDFSGLDSAYCPYDAAVNLSGTPTGGTFIGDGISGDDFIPALAATGSATSVTYSYSDANNCTASKTTSTLVYQDVNAAFTGLNSSYCQNAAFITLFGTPAGGTFSGPGITGNHFDPLGLVAGNSYDLVYVFTDTTGCIFSDPASVAVDPLPVVSISGLDSLYCSDDAPVTLNGSPAGGSFSGAGITGDVFYPDAVVAPNAYLLTYSYADGNGCTDLAKANVTVEECTGEKNYSLQNDFTIYPNPAQDRLFIRSSLADEAHFRLYTMTGKTLQSFTNRNVQEMMISIAELSSGIYYLEMLSGTQKMVRKVVVQR